MSARAPMAGRMVRRFLFIALGQHGMAPGSGPGSGFPIDALSTRPVAGSPVDRRADARVQALRMEESHDGPHELERLLEHQMRVQERQLAWARLGMVVLAALLLVVVAPDVEGVGVLLAILAALAALSLATPFLLRRFPAREVGIVSTVAEMAAVTVAVYVASDALDAYLFYGLVILGVALRFGLAASIWASLVMSALYVAVVLAGGGAGDAVQELLPARIAYLIGFGVARPSTIRLNRPAATPKPMR